MKTNTPAVDTAKALARAKELADEYALMAGLPRDDRRVKRKELREYLSMVTPPLTDKVTRLKVWKRNQSPAEMLRALAVLAEEKPEEFAQMIVMYTDGEHRFNYVEEGTNKISSLIGLIECCKHDIMHDQG